MKEQEIIDCRLLNRKLEEFPWYVSRFMEHKMSVQCSPSSLLEYLRDYEIFFSWLIHTSKVEIESIDAITLSHLESLELQDFELYKQYLIVNRQLEVKTMTRKISSLKSLFNFLHDIAEDNSGNPLISRNVPRKITIVRATSLEESTKNVKDKILVNQDILDFLDYIENTYPKEHRYNKQAMYSFEVNHIRDICIISMQLLVGLRLSNVVDLNLEDIKQEERQIQIKHGSQIFSINFGESMYNYIQSYMLIRNATYMPDKAENAFFLSLPNGHEIGKRITKRAIQEIVKKYGQAYGKSELTARQLRHSFGVNHLQKNNMSNTKDQLLLSLESTQRYIYLSDLLEM